MPWAMLMTPCAQAGAAATDLDGPSSSRAATAGQVCSLASPLMGCSAAGNCRPALKPNYLASQNVSEQDGRHQLRN